MSFPWSSRISATRIIPGEATPSPHFHHLNDEISRLGCKDDSWVDATEAFCRDLEGLIRCREC
ncbi:hypothetical protein BKH32_07765 [Actinomyces oris]|uniref:Uncharacterized protein n=1 Tax=Actinomyces oris TaxID=544580 RepID=A0A1Q8I0D0_9ACTO|nr:hypothetical protein BKH32_07765 [Actinomyces oris]